MENKLSYLSQIKGLQMYFSQNYLYGTNGERLRIVLSQCGDSIWISEIRIAPNYWKNVLGLNININWTTSYYGIPHHLITLHLNTKTAIRALCKLQNHLAFFWFCYAFGIILTVISSWSIIMWSFVINNWWSLSKINSIFTRKRL